MVIKRAAMTAKQVCKFCCTSHRGLSKNVFDFQTKRHFSKSSKQLKKTSTASVLWQKRQDKDIYVKQAQAEGWRCRSAYKLIEINHKYNILRPGQVVIDCGAAPGSWSQVEVQQVQSNMHSTGGRREGQVFSIDLLKIEPKHGAVIIDESDFTSNDLQSRLLDNLNVRKVNVVLSDMAPNATGMSQHDQEILVAMAASVLQFSTKVLAPNGHVLCKLWMGSELDTLENAFGKLFKVVKRVKPKSSRTDSAEVYLLGKYFIGLQP